ncbi:hypothetical protein CPLU01_11126 [Colletotrichum plurivorum]|uniref:Integral membrane protein n=1 Tax=Colletotrichum plurivorum TaxID=2175906 RepID=A0A8H6K2N2_9PEZI|nr:hypothetical protein CPLU01_11126 [Colletotrichum plurivorum]
MKWFFMMQMFYDPVLAFVRASILVFLIRLGGQKPGVSNDPFHNIGVVHNVVVVNLSIISASAPALQPMFRRWWPKLFGGIGSGKTSGLKYYGNASRPRNTARNGDNIALKNMRMTRRGHHTEIRSTSLTESEDEIMTYNGIVRTTNVNLTYESASVGDDARSSPDFETG